MIKFEFNKMIGRLNPNSIFNKLSKIASKVIKNKGVISVAIIDDKTIKRLNNKYRNKNKATDILTFVLADEKMLGEIIIGYEQLKKRAYKMKTNILGAFTYLLVHGFCHILGFSHNKIKDTEKMELQEDKFLKYLGYRVDRENNLLFKS